MANVGDSRGIILTESSHELLTYDHKGTDANEIARVKLKYINIII